MKKQAQNHEELDNQPVLSGKRAVIVTGHFPVQKRRANILWVCDNMRKNGWHVTMVTVGYSWLTKLLGDVRLRSIEGAPVLGETVHDATLTGVFQYAPLHPFSVKVPVLDKLLRPLHMTYELFWERHLPKHVADADLVLVESGPPVMLAPIIRKAAPDAAMVYRVSDDVAVLGLPEFLVKAELKYASLFDRISVASPFLAKRFAAHNTVRRDAIGVPKAVLDQDVPDPYAKDGPRSEREAVCAGTTQFDMAATQLMAELRPNWNFHVFGRLRGELPEDLPPNLILHGEQPYTELAGWVKHADIGIAPYLVKRGVEYQTHQSNRMLMYRYFGLPMIGPDRLCDPEVPSLIGYTPNDRDSMARALDEIEKMDRDEGDPEIQDWSYLYGRIVSTLKPGKTAA